MWRGRPPPSILTALRERIIPIEQRDPKEVSHMFGRPLAPKGTRVFNPAFDVTSQDLISAIITEKGVIHPPYQQNIRTHVSH